MLAQEQLVPMGTNPQSHANYVYLLNVGDIGVRYSFCEVHIYNRWVLAVMQLVWSHLTI